MKYELKKLLTTKKVWILFAGLLITYTLMIRQEMREPAGMQSNRDLFRLLEDVRTANQGANSQYAYILNQHDMLHDRVVGGDEGVFSKPGTYGVTLAVDWMLYVEAKNHAEYVLRDMNEKRKQLVLEAIDQYAENEEHLSAYERRVYRKKMETYNRYIRLELASVGSEEYLSLFQDGIGDIIMVLFCICLTVFCFSQDRENGMYIMIACCKRGGKENRFERLAALWVVCTGVHLCITAAEVIFALKYCGMWYVNLPIQMYRTFSESVWNITILDYLLLQALLKLLVYTMILLVCAWITLKLRSVYLALIASAGVILLPFLYTGYLQRSLDVSQVKFARTLRMFLPQDLIYTLQYFRGFDICNVFGMVGYRVWVALMLLLIVGVAAFLGIIKHARKGETWS